MESSATAPVFTDRNSSINWNLLLQKSLSAFRCFAFLIDRDIPSVINEPAVNSVAITAQSRRVPSVP